MRRAGLIPCFFLLSVVIVAPLHAQWQLTGETGISRLKQAGLPESNAFTLGGTIDRSTERTLLRSSVLGALTNDNRSTGQWVVVGSAATGAWNSAQLQITGALSAFGQTHLAATTSADVLLQGRIGNATRGFAAGGGVGSTSHNDVSIPVSRAIADGWWIVGAEHFNGEAAVTRTRSVFGESSILVDESLDATNYVDLGVAWLHERGGWSFGASAGLRGRGGSLANAASWQGIDAAAWVSSRVALAVSGGRTLEDLVRGVPRARFAGVSLRFSSQPHATVFGRARVGARMSVAQGAGGVKRIEVRVANATAVELMADFTGWSPIALERAGDAWRLERVIPPGSHRVAIRVDGGAWIVPVNLPRVEDDLAGGVGLITIP